MASIIKVDTIQDQDGNNIINENADTITIGASGDTVTIPSGATIDASGATLTLPTTIEVDAIEPQSGTTLTLGASGDTITIPSGATITNSGTATGFGGGKVLQVVSALKTDTFSASVTAGSSTAVTDLSITHTLSNSSNKLLLMAYFGAAASADQIMPIGIALADDGTLIGIGDAASSRTRVGAGGAVTGTGNGYVVSMPHIHLLYSPGDTSSHTYTVNIINVDTATRTLYVNRTLDVDDNAGFPRSASAITLMEISA